MEKSNVVIEYIKKIKEPNYQKLSALLFDASHKSSYSEENIKTISEMIYFSHFEAKYRKEYYLIASGAQLSLLNFPNYYNDIINNFPSEIPSFDYEKIKVDLSRTFPMNNEFTESKGEEKLGKILLAFSRRNPSIGYCQGFNFIAGRALVITKNEEEAFWLFTHLMEDIVPLNYFGNLYGVTIDHNIILSVVQRKYKDMFDYLHMASYDFFISNLINKWFLSLFTVNINEKLSYLIWDLLMIDKAILVKAPIGLIKLISEEIGTIDLYNDESLTHLTKMVKSINNEKYFLKTLISFDQLNYASLSRRRIKEEANSIPSPLKGKESNEQGEHCNILWNLCIENKSIRNEKKEYLIHRAYPMPKQYDNYFDWRDNRHKGLDINTNDNYFEMLLERIPHICEYNTTSNPNNTNKN